MALATIAGPVTNITGRPAGSFHVAAVRNEPRDGGLVVTDRQQVRVIDGHAEFTAHTGPAVLILSKNGQQVTIPILVQPGFTLEQAVQAGGSLQVPPNDLEVLLAGLRASVESLGGAEQTAVDAAAQAALDRAATGEDRAAAVAARDSAQGFKAQAEGYAVDASESATAARGYRDETETDAAQVSEDRGVIAGLMAELEELLGDTQALADVQQAIESMTDAYTAAIQAAVDDLRSGVDPAMDTLQELADALNNDPDFAANMAVELGKRALSTDVVAGLATKADEGHTHSWEQVTAKPSTFPASAHQHPWSEVTGKPGSFTPSPHRHGWGELDDVPATFTPAVHTHPISAVDGLDAALTGKEPAAWLGTQSEYDALGTKDPNRTYYVKG